MLQHLFADRFKYVSCDSLDIQAAAAEDPRGFLEINAPPVIFDEVQYCTGLLPYIKEQIDKHRNTSGQYLLSASQNLLHSESVTETLAGRIAILTLLPLSRREQLGNPQLLLSWERVGERSKSPSLSMNDLWSRILRGGFPEIAVQPDRDFSLWHSSYLQTYLDRDVRMLRQVGGLIQYQNFLRVLAARSGQLLNLTDVARDIGVAVNTTKSWLLGA